MPRYSVTPMFWAPTFPMERANPSTRGEFLTETRPYLPDDFTVALRSVGRAGYYWKL